MENIEQRFDLYKKDLEQFKKDEVLKICKLTKSQIAIIEKSD